MLHRVFKLLLFVSSLLFLLLLLCPTQAFSRSVELEWDANAAEDNVTGYKIYYGIDGNYTDSIDVGNVTTYTIIDLLDVCYSFKATAYSDGDEYLESDFSDEVESCPEFLRPATGLGAYVQCQDTGGPDPICIETPVLMNPATGLNTEVQCQDTGGPDPVCVKVPDPATGLYTTIQCYGTDDTPTELIVDGTPIIMDRSVNDNPKSVNFNLSEIPSTLSIVLTVWDADFEDEGKLDINGQVQILLFADGRLEYDLKLQILEPIQINTDWLVVGDNTLTFIHLRTGGYRIEMITIYYE